MEELICRALQGRASEQEQAELLAWRRTSVRNEQYYRDFVRMLRQTRAALSDVAERASRPTVEGIISRVAGPRVYGSGSQESIPPGVAARRAAAPALLSSGRRWLGTRAARRLLGALAAAASIAGIGLALQLLRDDSPAGFRLGTAEIITGAAEMTTVKLGDGSTVRLAPESRLLVSDEPGAREVWLEGRAYFAVRPNQDSPFRVRSHAGDAVVLGTRFDLQASQDRLRVLVVEGAVKLSDRLAASAELEVEASQLGEVTPSSPPTRQTVDAVHLENELRWLGNFLVFEGTPLQDVAAELSRHYGRSVEILDSRLGTETVRAMFFEESFEQVVEILCRALALRCSVRASGAIIGP